jgi:hypothetical protein
MWRLFAPGAAELRSSKVNLVSCLKSHATARSVIEVDSYFEFHSHSVMYP